jgi:uncharacterized protein
MKSAEKLVRLKEILAEMDSALIAYSGGTDSSFLAFIASEVLGRRALAVFEYSPVCPPEERDEAKSLAKKLGIRYLTIESNELQNPLFVANTQDRCYYCRQELFHKLGGIAAAEKIDWIIDGSNFDDQDDFRPGRRAAAELGVRSPLCEAGLTKGEIRKLSRDLALPTWDKPASPCLASRIPYGTHVTQELLNMISEGERHLRSLGIRELRLRHHGDIARIEVDMEGMALLLDDRIRREMVSKLKSLGYTYVTLDLAGYRSGSLNEKLLK